MSKFLPGIIFIQLLTTGLVLMTLHGSYDFQLLIVIMLIGLMSAILAAFWFAAIARNIYIDEHAQILQQHTQDKEALRKASEREKASVMQEKSQLKDQHARERERLLLDAERDKANILAESYRKIEKESSKAHAKANFKVGVAFTATVAIGGVLIFSQLLTIGTMLVVASGSGLSGYILRARQERLSRKKQLALNQTKLITDQSISTPLWRQKDRG